MPLTPPTYTPNPYYAWVKASIDGAPLLDLNDRPHRQIGFSYVRNASNAGGNRLSLTVFDKDWDVVESMITKSSKSELTFSYGYTNGIQSPTYKTVIIGYKPSFGIDGTKIVIDCVSQPFNDQEDMQRSRTFPGVTGRKEMEIHEIVQYIANERGWSVDFDETDTKLDNHHLEEAGLLKQHFAQNKMRDVQFIKEILAPRAMRKKDKSGDYRAFFEDTEQPKLHFHPPRNDQGPSGTYTFMRQKMSEVISFSPDINGEMKLKMGAGVSVCPYLDIQTGEYNYAKANNATTPEKQILGGELTVASDEDDEHASQSHSTPIRSHDHAEVACRDRYQKAFNSILGGELLIQGDPRLQLFKVIRVNVIKSDGGLHYSSGLYMISAIVDDISGGQFTSNMTLIRQGYTKASSGVSGDPSIGQVFK